VKKLAKTRIGALVVRPTYPLHVRLLLVILLIVLVVVAGRQLYELGLSRAGFERTAAAQHEQELQNEIGRLQADSQQLRESLARAERTLQTNQVAYQELERSMSESARQISKLREEITFYRNILSPENKLGGLQIYSLNLERAGREGDYRYRLVLIQALKHDRAVSGNGRMEVSGVQAGNPVVLSFPSADKPIRINFKYFQEIEGVLSLPRDFRPERVKVTVQITGADSRVVEQTYLWPAL